MFLFCLFGQRCFYSWTRFPFATSSFWGVFSFIFQLYKPQFDDLTETLKFPFLRVTLKNRPQFVTGMESNPVACFPQLFLALTHNRLFQLILWERYHLHCYFLHFHLHWHLRFQHFCSFVDRFVISVFANYVFSNFNVLSTLLQKNQKTDLLSASYIF